MVDIFKTKIGDSTYAPKFSIVVAGITVDTNISPFVKQVEYESCDGLFDKLSISCVNNNGEITKAKIFQPGNEVSLFLGYKEPLTHIGRVVLIKQNVQFPANDLPTVNVVGYTRDCIMADNSPEESKKRRFADYKYSDAVKDIATRYNMEADVDITPDPPHNWFQKSGLSDYDLVNGLANLTGFIFWVDGDENGTWTLHFRDPQKLIDQDVEYTFTYNDGDNSTLIDFNPQMLIQGSKTKIKVVAKDRKTGKIIEAEVEEDSNAAPDIEVTNDPIDEIGGEHTTASDIKLYFNDFSFESVSNKRFKTDAEAISWAQQWFRRNRDLFITASGTSIGAEKLLARQIHNISNTTQEFDGKYYFSKVRHILNESGYLCRFGCRRQTP